MYADIDTQRIISAFTPLLSGETIFDWPHPPFKFEQVDTDSWKFKNGSIYTRAQLEVYRQRVKYSDPDLFENELVEFIDITSGQQVPCLGISGSGHGKYFRYEKDYVLYSKWPVQDELIS